MVEHKPAYQLCLGGGTVLHLHNFDHVKIDRLPPLVHGICERPSQLFPPRKPQGAPFGGGGGLIVITASTTDSASCWARAALSFVARDVFAKLMRVGRSRLEGCLNVSKNWGTLFVS
jgi:hypothetical protein